MAGIQDLIRANEDGTISFGDSTLKEKAKKDGFLHDGDLYKVKTFREITKLEKNENFLFESVPGTEVREFLETEDGISFLLAGPEDAEVTVGLSDETEYTVSIDGKLAGTMTTGIGGKLTFGVELAGRTQPAEVEITRS